MCTCSLAGKKGLVLVEGKAHENELQEQDVCGAREPNRSQIAAALAAAGIADGHLAIELVDEQRIRQLNRDHRGRDAPTDVLSFPIDEANAVPGPRELGDVVICPEHSEDLIEAVVHGVLHLCGYDHETDDGRMRTHTGSAGSPQDLRSRASSLAASASSSTISARPLTSTDQPDSVAGS